MSSKWNCTQQNEEKWVKRSTRWTYCVCVWRQWQSLTLIDNTCRYPSSRKSYVNETHTWTLQLKVQHINLGVWAKPSGRCKLTWKWVMEECIEYMARPYAPLSHWNGTTMNSYGEYTVHFCRQRCVCVWAARECNEYVLHWTWCTNKMLMMMTTKVNELFGIFLVVSFVYIFHVLIDRSCCVFISFVTGFTFITP